MIYNCRNISFSKYIYVLALAYEQNINHICNYLALNLIFLLLILYLFMAIFLFIYLLVKFNIIFILSFNNFMNFIKENKCKYIYF